MNIKDSMKEYILKILKDGESEKVEFKVSFGKETIESLCAFANSKGGSVFIGVDDKGNVKRGSVKSGKYSKMDKSDKKLYLPINNTRLGRIYSGK